MHWPGVAEHATAVVDSPVADASVKMAPVTLLGPLLVTRTVYTVELPDVTLVTPSVFVTAKSETGVTVSVSVAESFPAVGSLVPEGAAIVAVLLTLPLVAVTVADTVIS